MTDEEWFARVAGLDGSQNGQPLFPLPDSQIQTSTTGRSGTPILRDAFLFWQFCRERLIQDGNGLSSNTKIMDFGCAWARILRFWLKDIPPENLYGYDVEDRFLSFAKRDLPQCNFTISSANPPLPSPDNSFDLIYAYSVFSHLPQGLTDRWISEFARVLKPGGIACLTTRPRAHIEIAGTDAEKTAHRDIYAKVFTDRDAALARYDAGEFIFYPAYGGGGLAAETYGEAIISPAYAEKNWHELELIGFFEKYSTNYLQPCFALRKSTGNGGA